MFITKQEARQHLNIDEDFHDDDALIVQYIQIAEDAVSKHLDRDLKEVCKDGVLFPSVKGAILLLIGNYYNNREAVTFGSPKEVPFSIKYLLQFDRKYSVG